LRNESLRFYANTNIRVVEDKIITERMGEIFPKIQQKSIVDKEKNGFFGCFIQLSISEFPLAKTFPLD
jgi:hypothetical protein